MIFDIVQTKTSFDMHWAILDGEENLAEAESPFMPNMFLAEVRSPSSLRKLIYDPNNTSYGTSLTDRLTFRVFDKDHYIGYIVGRTQKVKQFLGSYPYYEYVEDGVTYLVYEVGFGHKGLYLCFYRDNQLFCVVEKDLITVNFRDRYKCYLLESALLPVVATFVIYYDVVSYGDFMNIAVYSRSKSVVNTYQKELKKKFDPAFIPRIKAMDGISD